MFKQNTLATMALAVVALVCLLQVRAMAAETGVEEAQANKPCAHIKAKCLSGTLYRGYNYGIKGYARVRCQECCQDNNFKHYYLAGRENQCECTNNLMSRVLRIVGAEPQQNDDHSDLKEMPRPSMISEAP